MALFNKIFTNRRNTHNKHQDNVSEKLFAFSKDQIRVLLFRECDFRGRKLLFDSTSVKKIPLIYTKSGEVVQTSENDKFSEISDGHGYLYTKPQADFAQLAEMVFGSVAMSFRGTYFKIHNLEVPNRLMFTQVFSSPRHVNHSKVSVSSRSDPHSLQHSKLDDSGASSTSSLSEHWHSTTSDTILVCRRDKSTPLDVPIAHGISSSTSSLNGDSGYCGDHFFDISSGPSSILTWESSDNDASTISLSSRSLCKKWLRHTNTSLDNSGHSLTSSKSLPVGDQIRHPHRSSKLGLAFILHLTSGQEVELTQFFMEHVCLLEALLWRSRRMVEAAYTKSQNFASLMMEVSQLSAQYLVSLLSGAHLSKNLWLSLSRGCDNYNSISAFSASLNYRTLSVFPSGLQEAKTDILSSDSWCSEQLKGNENSGDFHLLSFSRFLKADSFNIKKNLYGEHRILAEEKFVQDFCELLEHFDVKNTNFFMSTLLTAVLTYHLGWVNTCLPTSDNVFQTRNPFNPLWGELSDLYGTVGHPTKTAQTIITGTRRKDLISKILITMTYFIRCCDVYRTVPIRSNVQEENKIVEALCCQHSCIPKENYKKYEDHLKEILKSNEDFLAKCCDNNRYQQKDVEASLKDKLVVKKTGFVKTRTCVGNLSELTDSSKSLYPELSSESLDLDLGNNQFDSLYPSVAAIEMQDGSCSTLKLEVCPSSDEIIKKVNTLCRVPTSAVLYHMDKAKSSSVIDQVNKPEIMNMEKQMRSVESGSCLDTISSNVSGKDRNVVFVLGDNEQLVGIKKLDKNDAKQVNPEATSCKSVPQRPSFLDLSKQLRRISSVTCNFKDSDFIENHSNILIQPSTSWSALTGKKIIDHSQKLGLGGDKSDYGKKFSRSQSEPPEDRKLEESKTKSKYRYSGVKFNLQQHPQILSNYMKSQNLEISNLRFGDKSLKMDELSSLSDTIISKYPELDEDYDGLGELQTPSNASELEFTSDLFDAPSGIKQSHESNVITQISNGTSKEVTDGDCDSIKKTERKSSNSCSFHKMKITNLPMPKSALYKPLINPVRYTSSLMRAASDVYMPDMVLQGAIVPIQDWESRLKSDLALASQHSLIDQPVEEAVAVIANTDTWEVRLMSSHTFIIDNGSSGIRIGMSQLVSNMLESLLHMWKLKVPPHFCLMHIEQTLQELCVRSKALAELLLATEFCNMEQLTSTLQLEVNDVPLLLAVASTHSPQVTQKYGLSFQ